MLLESIYAERISPKGASYRKGRKACPPRRGSRWRHTNCGMAEFLNFGESSLRYPEL